MSIPSLTVLQQGGGLLPEVEAFEDFHEWHGPTGGWHPDDHAEFGSILKACKGDYSHATLMCYDQMIGFKRADIIAHTRYEATKSGVRDTTVESGWALITVPALASVRHQTRDLSST